MRLKKIAAAALALAMTVSMVSVPVFAAKGDNAEDQNDVTKHGVHTSKTTAAVSGTEQDSYNSDTKTSKTAGTASTEVNIIYSTDASQLSVTVPIGFTVAVNGSRELITPSNYAIVNNSVIPVYVDTIEVTPTGGYQLVSSNPDATKNEIKISMKPNSGAALDLVTDDATTETMQTIQSADKKDWNMTAATTTAATDELKMTFEGSVGAVDGQWAAKQHADGVHLFTITYTIAAGAAGNN